jgi:hypothetical protein
METIIKRNGQTVHCYGEFDVYCNVHVCFEDESWDGVFCPDTEDTCWTDMVERITKLAIQYGTTVEQMEMV